MTVATINRDGDAENGRLTLTLERDADSLRWYCEGQDTEVSGETEEDAIEAASAAWGDSIWDLEIE